MSEKLNTGTTDKKLGWPKTCVWPAPIDKNGGFDWDEDLILDELDEYTQELVDIKEYFDKLVEEGRLDENYCLNPDYEDCDDIEEDVDENTWQPEIGDDYWTGEQFDIKYWREELTASLNSLKIEACDPDPILEISNIINYRFINENLMRQAFTRRAFQIEYGLSGCSEELEFLGDSVLSMVTTKELMKQFSSTKRADTSAPFHVKLNEGEFSRLKTRFVCKEHLAGRCETLGLDTYILYGTGEEHTESSREDAVEALIGAVAIDCDYDMSVLEEVIDRLVNIQVTEKDGSDAMGKNYYDTLNKWHRRHFGCLPEYEVYRQSKTTWSERAFMCVIKFLVPENDKDIWTAQSITYDGNTRSQARELAARAAYRFIVDNGLWSNLKNANIVPEPDKAVNQLQELYQKKYIEQAVYEFDRDGSQWECICQIGHLSEKKRGFNKADAKKKAAYAVLIALLKEAGVETASYEYISDTLCDDVDGVQPSVIHIPAKPSPGGLKYNGLVSVLEQIEQGKVITEKELLKWLGNAYGINNLMVNWNEVPSIPTRKEDDAPWHRLLTTTGLVNGWYKDKLIEEGHEVVETKTDNWRVLDYKETMVDVKKLIVPDMDTAVGPCGSYMDNMREDLKAFLLEKAKKYSNCEGCDINE